MLDVDEEEHPDDIHIVSVNDVEADTATVIEMAAHMLDNDGAAAYCRACEIPLGALPSTMGMAASMIATLAEHLAEHEYCSAEHVLLELRNWTEGDSNE